MAGIMNITSDIEEDADIPSSPLKVLHQGKGSEDLRKRKFSDMSAESSDSSNSDSDHDIIPSDNEDIESQDPKETVNKVANAMQQILSATGKSHILVPSKKKKGMVPILIAKKKTLKDKYRRKDLGGPEISHEKKLKTIATIGVVQLFASIEAHRKKLTDSIAQADGEFARKRTLEEFGEETFKHILDKQASKKIECIQNEELETKASKKTSAGKSGWAAITKHLIPQTATGGWDEQSSDDDEDS